MCFINTERIWAINSYIQLKGEVHLKELMALYPDLSSMTIRRDVAFLEEKGHIVRTRGGAKSINHLTQLKEEIYSKRAGENVQAKVKIAKKASTLLKQEGAVYFDSGSTIMNLATRPEAKGLFAITSGANISLELSRIGASKIIVIGGNLNPDNLSVSGPSALEQIKSINIEFAFIATSGFSLGAGFTLGSFDEGELKRRVIAKAQKVAVLMDTSKVGQNLPYTFARLSDIDYLVSESNLPDDIIEKAKQENVKLI